MCDFLTRFLKPLSLVVMLLLAGITYWLTGRVNFVEQQILPYLSNVVGWLGVLVLFWLWNFEKSWKQDLKSSLSRKVNRNEELISQLWNAFSEQNAEVELEKKIRNVLERYPTIVLQHKDLKIGEKVRATIANAEYILQQREYRERYEATNVYPGPFYEIANKAIIATNIGGIGNFWIDRDTLVELNRTAVERIKPTLQNGNDPVRRVFIVNKVNIDDELKELMDQLLQVGVTIKYLDKQTAEELAAADATGRESPIAGLEDFTVFDTDNEKLKYSGRFEDLGANQKRILISSNPQTIESLISQFNALWSASYTYEGEIDASVFARLE